jgi:hypothetical protein
MDAWTSLQQEVARERRRHYCSSRGAEKGKALEEEQWRGARGCCRISKLFRDLDVKKRLFTVLGL